jgi:HPt (histidine-containing phosphotransfer) domain-containing protein
MLIYNFEKNFLGIDESDLRILGFQDFSSLRAEAADFADLFVKTPGYIHNFKHVHWIDFIACAESSDDSKVIIHANNRTFKCNLDLKTIYLIDNPTSQAYIITLQNLRELTNNENKEISNDIASKPTPLKSKTTVVSDVFHTATKNPIPTPTLVSTTKVTPDPYEIDIHENEFDKPASLDIIDDIYEPREGIGEVQEPKVVREAPKETVKPQEVEKVEDDFKLDIDVTPEEISQERATSAQIKESEVESENDGYDSSYVYDPNVASSELGLPVDLIEEFIEDFIAQSKEFKDDLYSALETSDMDKLKIQSHKLKGVAANLRIEDAFNVLTIINSSSDVNEIQKNLKIFYKIIAVLSGESAELTTTSKVEKTELPQVETENIPTSPTDNEEELVIDFKDDFSTAQASFEEEKLDDFDDTDNLVLEFKDETSDDLYIDHEDKDEPLSKPSYKEENFMELEFTEPIATPEPPEQVEPEITKLTYNKKQAASEIGLDIDTFNELFLDYIEGCQVSADEIKKAIEKDNPQQWRASAIQIKGMSDNMRVEDFTADLETIIETQNKSVAQDSLVKIESLIGKISDLGA